MYGKKNLLAAVLVGVCAIVFVASIAEGNMVDAGIGAVGFFVCGEIALRKGRA